MSKFMLGTDIETTLKTWMGLFKRLTFNDNFSGYESEVEFGAGETKQIPHTLKLIPTRFIITSAETATAPVLQPGLPKATSDYFYLTSTGAFKGKVLIMP